MFIKVTSSTDCGFLSYFQRSTHSGKIETLELVGRINDLSSPQSKLKKLSRGNHTHVYVFSYKYATA